MGKKNNTELMLYNEIRSAMPLISNINKSRIVPGRNIPEGLIADIKDSGVFLGLERDYGNGYYVGKGSDVDGNILTIGINGSGKSRFLVKSTLETWQYPVVALDIKGELASHYDFLRRKGICQRSHIVFDPTKGGVSYDVYALLDRNDPHFVQYVKEISYAIIPMPLNVREPYWINMARDFLSGAIAYYYDRGHNFINTMLLVHQTSVASLCKEIMTSDCALAKTFVSEISALKAEHKAAIGTEVKQHTMVFATDPDVQDVLSPSKEGSDTFSWKEIVMNLDAPNVFLCLDQSRLEQWSAVIRLMVTQLIRQIERRPDKYSDGGYRTLPILLLLDEFPLLGRIWTSLLRR